MGLCLPPWRQILSGAIKVYSLAHRNPREKSLSIHRLVQAVLQDEMKEVERQCWAERAVLAVNAAFPHVEHRVWPQCERLLPHALLAIRYIETDYLVSEEAGRLLYETASYFQDHARYSEAELLFQHARDIFEHQVGLEHPQVTSTLHGLADTYRDQEKDTEAEPLYLEALRIIEQQLGETYPDVIYPLHGLVHIYTPRGEYELAETFYQRAMTIREQTLGVHHPKTMETCTRLIALLHAMGRYEKAVQLEAVQSEI